MLQSTWEPQKEQEGLEASSIHEKLILGTSFQGFSLGAKKEEEGISHKQIYALKTTSARILANKPTVFHNI